MKFISRREAKLRVKLSECFKFDAKLRFALLSFFHSMRFKKKKTWKVRLEPKNEGFSFLLYFYAGILREFQISSITLSIVIVYQFYRQMSTRIRLHKLRRQHHRRSGTPPSFSGSYKVEPDASNFINNLSILIKNFKINRVLESRKRISDC